MNGVSGTSVGQGLTGADEAYFPARTIVARGPASFCVISITAVVAVTNKMNATERVVAMVPPRHKPLEPHLSENGTLVPILPS